MQETKDKVKRTNLKRYGFEYASQNPEIKQKTSDTNIVRYGTTSPMRSKTVRDKLNSTVKKRYGVDNISQLQETKDKKIQTTIMHYGVEHHMQDNNIQTKAFIKRNKTMYLTGQIACSSQQLYINKLINGDLNYPVSHITLDIKVEDDIYIEYDGGGHDLNVK